MGSVYMFVFEVAFYFFMALAIYNYLGYPLLITFLAYFCGHQVKKKDIEPFVSLVVAALNEEAVIGEKIKNCLDIDYPKEKLEVVVVSDGSIDSTEAIVKSFSTKRVKSVHQVKREGKTAALNRGVSASRGEILVFSDANNLFEKDALRMLVRNFADDSVGGVCGLKSIIDDDRRSSSKGDSFYWRYESFIKERESETGSITTGDGEIFAIRKELFKPLDSAIINDDTAITFSIVIQDKRVVYERDAISKELASITLRDDFNVKARMVAGGFQSFVRFWRQLLDYSPFFTFKFISHKVLRWLVPYFLIIIFVLNALLFGHNVFFQVLFMGQILFYCAAGVELYFEICGKRKAILYFPMYFCVMNLGALWGSYLFYKGLGDFNKIWKKARR